MERLGCLTKFLNMVIKLHKDQRGQVRLNSDLSGLFPIVNGVKQGCVLAPTLFSIFFGMMLKQGQEDLNNDGAVYIRYRLYGSLFNLRRLHVHTKTLLYSDLPHRKSSVAPNFLLCTGCPALRTRGHLEED